MSFNSAERELLAQLADVLIPPAEGYLSASEAGVAGAGLDAVLETCPEMAKGLRELLNKAVGRSAAEVVADLRVNDATAFGVLAEFAAGSYFMNPAVRQAIQYEGQTARAIDPYPDYLDDGLLDSVIQRGPIYRPTP